MVTLVLTGCLTCETKEYIFQLKTNNSGRLTIRYINIFSSLVDSAGELNSDYAELVDLWLQGEKIERDFPQATRFKKRLYEEQGVLCGEITMEFDDLSKVRLYRHQNQGAFMFNMASVNDDGENFSQTNGKFGGDLMPVIFWPETSRTLKFTTRIAAPDSSSVSMLDRWKFDVY
jgi:hypothetical protein